MATLKDVASLAGVDASTASRVLRSDPAQAARPETRRRILEAAEHLQYRPDTIARSLRLGRTDTVALLSPGFDNIGFGEITRGVQAAATAAHFLVLLADATAAGDSPAGLHLRGRIDGLLVGSARDDDPVVQQLMAERMPLVLVNRRVRGAATSVTLDDAAGARAAVDALAALGHEHIAHVAGDLSTDTGRRRLRGFEAAVRSQGLDVRSPWVADGGYTEPGGRAAMAKILGARTAPTAVFVGNLMSAFGALRSIVDAGLRVPDDISLIAMDEHPLCAVVHPPLSTVAMPLFEMGHLAMTSLIDLIGGAKVGHRVVEAPAEVRVRASMAAPAA